jgi:Holliday junction resolvasome RuvABC endonuclease subunit
VKIMGLDLSITATGVCLPDGTTYTIKTKTVDRDRRITIIRDRIAMDLWGVDLVVLEDFPARLQAAAAKAIGITHGAIRALLLDFGVPYVVVPPSSLKFYATGNGNADKAAMILAAYKRGDREFTDDNQCDAWWLHLAGRDRTGDPFFSLPQVQRDCLNKLDWSPVPS